MISELNHVCIHSSAFEADLLFYTGTLGGRIFRDITPVKGGTRFVYIQLGGGIVELVAAQSAADAGYNHVAFYLDADDLDACCAHLMGLGLEFTTLPRKASTFDGRIAFFNEPSGVSFELLGRPAEARLSADESLPVSAFAYTAIGAGDRAESTARFCAEELGMAREGEFCRLNGDALRITGEPGGILYMAFAARDAAAIRRRIAAAGIEVRDGVEGFATRSPSGEKILILQERG